MRNRPLGFETLEDRRLLASVWPPGLGFAANVFVNASAHLSKNTFQKPADLAGLTRIVWSTSSHAKTAAIGGSPNDTNGPLLFPDGQIREQVWAGNGGKARSNGQALGVAGREAVVDFVLAGGSYVGSCATMFQLDDYSQYTFGLWPGVMGSTGTGSQTVSFAAIPDHPISQFLVDHGVTSLVIPKIPQIGGPKIGINPKNPEGTIYLGTITSSTVGTKGRPYMFEYEISPYGNILLPEPGHAEYNRRPEHTIFMAAQLSYAASRAKQAPDIKGDLTAGAPVSAVVGDGQYHRYSMNVPAGLAQFTVTTSAPSGTEVYVTHDGVAYDGGADYSGDSITVTAPPGGQWEVSVLGTHDVANGEPYTLTVDAVRDNPIFNGLGEGEMSETEKRLATAAELMASRPDHIDWDVAAWAGATVRLVRLDGPAKLRAALAAEKIDQEDRESFYEFGVDLLADSIVDAAGVKQFAEATAKRWLSGEIGAVGELVPIAIDLNGLGADTVAGEVESAGKN